MILMLKNKDIIFVIYFYTLYIVDINIVSHIAIVFIEEIVQKMFFFNLNKTRFIMLFIYAANKTDFSFHISSRYM